MNTLTIDDVLRASNAYPQLTGTQVGLQNPAGHTYPVQKEDQTAIVVRNWAPDDRLDALQRTAEMVSKQLEFLMRLGTFPRSGPADLLSDVGNAIQRNMSSEPASNGTTHQLQKPWASPVEMKGRGGAVEGQGRGMRRRERVLQEN